MPSTKKTKGVVDSQTTKQEIQLSIADLQLPAWIFDPQTLKIIDVNTTAIEHYGYTRREFMCMSISDLCTAEHKEGIKSRHTSGQEVIDPSGMCIHIRKGGEQRHIAYISKTIQVNSRDAKLVILRDITTEVEARQALDKSKHQLSALLGNLPGMAYRCKNDEHWTMEFISEGSLELTGYKPDELIDNKTTSYGDLLHPDDRQKVWDDVQAALKKKQTFQLTYRIRTATGQEKWVWEQGRGVYDEDGTFLSIEGFISDISEKKRFEQALQESEQRFRSLYENTTIGMYRTTSDGQILLANPALVDMLGYDSLAELTQNNLSPSNFAPDYSRKNFTKKIEQDGEIRGLEAAWKRKDGSTIFVRESAKAIRDNDGKTIYYEGTVEDVTERKQAEIALEKSERDYRQLFENANDAVLIFEPENEIILEANQAACTIYGFSYDELVGMSLKKITKEIEHGEQQIQELLKAGEYKNFETVHYTKSGDEVYFLINASVIEYQGKKAILSLNRDITERKQAEAQIQHRINELEALYQNGLALSQTLDAKSIAERVIQVLGERLNWHHAAVRVRREDSDDVELLAFGRPGANTEQIKASEQRAQNMITHIGQGMAGWVIQQGTSILSNNLSQDKRYVRTFGGMNSGLYVPIKIGKRMLGCISVETMEPQAFSEGDERLLSTLAAQTGVALENARLFERIQHRTQELELLAKVSAALRVAHDRGDMPAIIIEQIIQLLDIDGAAIGILDSQGKISIELGSGAWEFWQGMAPPLDGVSAQVISSGETFYSSDVPSDSRVKHPELTAKLTSIMCIPLIADQRPIGILWAGQESPISDFKQRLLTAVADMAANAMHRASLHEQTQSHAKQVATVNEIGRTLAETLDISEVFKRLTAALYNLFPDICGAFISLYDADQQVITCGCAHFDGQYIDHKKLPPIPLDITGAGSQSQVILTQKSLIVNNLTEKMKRSKVKVSVGKPGKNAQAALYVPMLARGKVIGIIQVQSYTPKRFTQPDITLLSLVANTAAVEIQNTYLLQETRQQAQHLAKVNELSRSLVTALDLQSLYRILYQYVSQLIEANNFGISFFNEKDRSLTAVFMVDDGQELNVDLFPKLYLPQAGEPRGRMKTITTGRTVIVNDLTKLSEADKGPSIGSDKEPKSAIYTPIVIEQKVIGIIEAQSYNNYTYPTSAIGTMNMIANQVGLTIQNTQLFEQLNHRVDQLSALHSIDTAINASTDLRISLAVVLENIRRLLDIDATDVLLLNPTTLTLEYASGSGFRTPIVTQTSIQIGESLVGMAALKRESISVADLSLEPNFIRTNLVTQEGFVTYHAIPLVAKGQVRGALEIFTRSSSDADPDWMSFLEVLAGQAAIAVDSAMLFNNLERVNLELTMAYDATIEGWSNALELRDRETQGHTLRVTKMTMDLANEIGVADSKMQAIRRGTLLHDIGKMGIPDQILHKPGPLTDEEWEIMRKHPIFAYNLLSSISYLSEAVDIPYCHHEKWDGSGYPRGLKGEAIPLSARIFAIVDVYDALTSDRPYRAAWSHEKTMDYIHEQSGIHFDPQVVEAFDRLMQHR